VPDVFQIDIQANARIVDQVDERKVPEKEDKPRPTPEQISANKEKWGYDG